VEIIIMKIFRTSILIVVFVCLAAATAVFAQDDGLMLKLERLWGYGGFNGDIQGTFLLKCSGPPNLAKVEFFMDDKKMGEAASAPFNLQFVTDNYPVGLHVLSAVGSTTDGKQLRSQTLTANFVSAGGSTKTLLTITVPILAIVFGAIILSAVIPMITGRKKINLPAGAQRNYRLGGGICPKCGRPFAFQPLGLKLLVARYERCPYCGKFSLVKSASMENLRAAEQAELEAEKPQVQEVPEEDKLKQELDDSKYQTL
jgi:hypothetical protein